MSDIEVVLFVPVAVGSTTSGKETARRHAEVEVTTRSSFPSAQGRRRPLRAETIHFAEVLALQPSPGAEEMAQEIFVSLAGRPDRFERQMNRLRGKFARLSGSSQTICRLPDFNPRRSGP
jgi:hypothetical protein